MLIDLKEVYEFTIKVAEEAGSILLKSSHSRTSSDHKLKQNSVDIVTEVDEAVEAFIKKEVLSKYPTHKFVGEESYGKDEPKDRYIIGNEPTWCVDPLDGTVNFVHMFPMVCTSIAFLIDGKPVVGVINAPFLNQTFSAYKGGGAWLNKSTKLPILDPIPPFPQESPKGLLFSCEWGKNRDYNGDLKLKIESFINMAKKNEGGGMVHGVRSLGSAALDMAFIAMGSTDIFWELGCWEWDIAAGVILVEESGGLVTNGNPPLDHELADIGPAHLGSRQYLAIRATTSDNLNETARESQERIVREVWKRVNKIDYKRLTIK